MARLDYKVTVWRRLEVNDDLLPEVIERLKEGDVDPYDLVDEYPEGIENVPIHGADDECEEFMTLYENQENSTIEIYDGDDNIIYRNGTENEE